jgi:hypothetical protein
MFRLLVVSDPVLLPPVDVQFPDHRFTKAVGIYAIRVNQDTFNAGFGGDSIHDAVIGRVRHSLEPIELVNREILRMKLQVPRRAGNATRLEVKVLVVTAFY